jgi:hypothetical protein
MTLIKGQLFSISLEKVTNIITGLVVDHNKDWLLIKYVPVDFVVDGYMIIRREIIKKYWRRDEEKFRESVLKAKKVTAKSSWSLSRRTKIYPLAKMQQKAILIQLNLEKEDICYVGIIKDVKKDSFVLEKMGTKANWLESMEYNLNSVWTIQFGNDYLESLLAFHKSKRRKP